MTEQTKLAVLLNGLQSLFKLIPSNGPVDAGMLGMLLPVLDQGLVLVSRKVNKLPPEQLAAGQHVFALALTALADGLDDPAVDLAEYQGRLEKHMAELTSPRKAAA